MDSLVFSNFLHRPARTIVSVLGIAVGVLLIVLTIGMTNGSLRDVGSRSANVGAEIILAYSGESIFSSDAFFFPIDIKEEIEKLDGIQKVVPVGKATVRATDNRTGSHTGNRRIEGINYEEYSEIVGIKILEGRPFSQQGDEVIIDTAFQRQKKLKIGDKLPMYERDFTIVGMYEPAAGARVKMSLAVMQKQLSGKGKVSSFLVKIKKGQIPEQMAKMLHNKFPDNKVLLTSEMEELFMQGFPALDIFLNVVISVSAVISSLIILLTMYTAVTERTRQIGIMKSLGMSNRTIAWIISQEALLVSFCGVIIGILLSILLKFLITKVFVIDVELDLFTILITLIISLAGGIVGAVYPALRAARMDAVEALNYE